jgi:hypothetical protein
MPESDEAMQKVKRQSISLITKNQRVNVRFFNPKKLLLFDALYYVTPNSYHPSLKSPDSIQYIRDSLVKQCEITQHQDKIFVMRLAKRGRALTNEEAIKKYLEKNGFVSVDPESLELKDQIAVFSSAKIVIGIMGAAMTNTTFCAPNTDVIYLAPEGWMEPFYWDLANVVKQRYHVIYGINQKNNFIIPKLIQYYLSNELNNIELGNLYVRREFNDINFVIKIYIALIKFGKINNVYNICSGNSYNIIELIDIIEKTNYNQKRNKIKYNISKKFSRENEILNLVGDSGKLKNLFTEFNLYFPETNINNTIHKMLNKSV